MPSETFYKLPNSKKNKIIKSAKKEFSRVLFDQTSIKNIVEDAEIARGSFYQYFENKQDLIQYIISEEMKDINKDFEKIIEMENGDIFNIFIAVYNTLTEKKINIDDFKFYRKLIQSMRMCDELKYQDSAMFKFTHFKVIKIDEYISKIKLDNLKFKNKEDLVIIIKLLRDLTKRAIIKNMNAEDEVQKQKIREEFERAIYFIKVGTEDQKIEGGKNV